MSFKMKIISFYEKQFSFRKLIQSNRLLSARPKTMKGLLITNNLYQEFSFSYKKHLMQLITKLPHYNIRSTSKRLSFTNIENGMFLSMDSIDLDPIYWGVQ